MLHLYLLVLLFIKSIQCEEDRNVSLIYKKLRDDILKDYDRNARPALYSSNVTMIKIEMHFASTFEIDEQAQTINVDSYMAMLWPDHHLTWDYKNYEGITVIQLSPNEIWMPDIYEVFNGGATSDLRKSDFNFIVLDYGGYVHWLLATKLPGRCTFGYNNYPTDVAECKIILEAWSHKKFSVDVEPVVYNYMKESDFPKQVNSQWEITNIVGKRETWQVYPFLVFTLTLARKTPILQQQLMWIASIVVIILTLAMFWIPSDIEQKMTVGCVIVVIMTAVLLVVASSVRARQPGILIAATIHNLIFATIVAILLEIIAINLQHIQEWKPPEILLSIFSGTVGRILLISSTQQEMPSLDKMKLSENESGEAMQEQLDTTGNWKTISQALDRVAFLLYIIILSAMPKTP